MAYLSAQSSVSPVTSNSCITTDNALHIKPIIIAHGGAGIYTTIKNFNESEESISNGLNDAAKAGYAILTANGKALDAVEAAVVFLENNPIFNAGKGSCLTVDSSIEMDACIMDGSTLNAGGVACIRNIANPVKAARLVLEKSDHVLLCADGALQFAKSHGMEEVPTEDLITKKAIERLVQCTQSLHVGNDEQKTKEDSNVSSSRVNGEDHDTVGAVAVDVYGNFAYATSTGGLIAKRTGRIGDSSIIGCGGYADNETGVVGTTGHGESFMKTCLARHISILMGQGVSAQKAVEAGLELLLRRVQGEGGCIAIDCRGNVGIGFTTQGMAWAYCQSDQLHYGIYQNEHITVPIGS